MAVVSSFFQMTGQQQEIEKCWTNILKQVEDGKTMTHIILPPATKALLGNGGVNTIAQRCRYVLYMQSY